MFASGLVVLVPESVLVQSTLLCLRQKGSSSLVMMRLGDLSADVAYTPPSPQTFPSSSHSAFHLCRLGH